MLLAEILKTGLCAFEHRGDGQFVPLSEIPKWLAHITQTKAGLVSLDSPFLENFLIDANHFWDLHQPGRLRSGPWVETDPNGEEWALEASAIISENIPYLLLEALGATYDEKRRILQRAREHDLEFQALTKAFKEHALAARDHAREAAKLQSLISDAPVNLTVTDGDGTITLAQGNDLHDFCSQPEDLIGQSITSAFASRPEVIERFHWAMAGEYVKGIEGHQEQVFEVTYSILRGQHNQAIGVVRHAHDISDRAKAADLVAQAINDVHEHYQQGFGFLELVSQELRGPLMAMVGFMDLIRDGSAGPINAVQHEYLSDINRSGEHLLSLLGDLSSYAKIEAGRLQPKLEPTELHATVSNAVNSVQRSLERAQAQLEVRVPKQLTLLADPPQLREIIKNLLEHALRHQHNGLLLLDAQIQGPELVLSISPALKLEPSTESPSADPMETSNVLEQPEGMRLALTRRLIQLHHGLLYLIEHQDALEIQVRFPANAH